MAGRRLLGMRPGTADEALAEQLADQLDRMKGMAMKVGQVMSYLDVPLPPAAQARLARLQAGSVGMPPHQARAMLEQGLGAPAGDLFDHFEDKPVAAASIGQVHRARLDTIELAVKIQYPDVTASLAADMAVLKRIGALASMATAADGRGIVDELAARLDEECDYAREAAMQTAFRSAFADDSSLQIPTVVLERSGPTVLTTHWVDGDTFETLRRDAEPARRAAAGLSLARFALRSIYEFAAVQADPHPGNYIFEPNDRTTMLDFGCVGLLDVELIDQLKRLVAALRAEDRPAFRQASFDIGMVGQPKNFDFDHHFRSMAYFFRPLLQAGFRFSPAYAAELHEYNGFTQPNARQLAVPPPFVWILRVQAGLWAILNRLQPDIDLTSLFDDVLARPTVPLRPRATESHP